MTHLRFTQQIATQSRTKQFQKLTLSSPLITPTIATPTQNLCRDASDPDSRFFAFHVFQTKRQPFRVPSLTLSEIFRYLLILLHGQFGFTFLTTALPGQVNFYAFIVEPFRATKAAAEGGFFGAGFSSWFVLFAAGAPVSIEFGFELS